MTDNARIVREDLAYLKDQSVKYDDYRSFEAEDEAWVRVNVFIATLETKLATAQADLERAREAMDYALAGFNAIYDMTRKKSSASNMAAYHGKKIRAPLDPEQKGAPEQPKARSVSDYTAEELVSRAVRNARPHEAGEAPRWAAISDVFALGSTYSAQLCRIHGLDPEEKVSGPRCISCNP